MNCRFCNNPLNHVFADLDHSPASNSYLSNEKLIQPESFYPLKVLVCEKCFLVQVDEFKPATEIFDQNYAYFSSYSKSWLEHSKDYANMMIERFNFDNKSLVVELASNDGYLLQYFKNQNIPVLGIEPTKNTAKAAVAKGINTITEFFGVKLANKLKSKYSANLIAANNVLAHVPDLNDFVGGIKILLEEDGVVTVEFPHLYELIKNNQFDTIYHEHFSYFSFYTVNKVFNKHGLKIFDVEQIPTHGGSLRIYATHKLSKDHKIDTSVSKLLDFEKNKKLLEMSTYTEFQENINSVKNNLLKFLIEKKKDNKIVVGYGAAAKGNTLLNYAGVRKDLLRFIVDASPHKQGKFIPGMHIPIVEEKEIKKLKPDYVLVLPWNLIDEIKGQLSYINNWGGKFVTAVPDLKVL
jgi:SAM-dependent methyltransferase